MFKLNWLDIGKGLLTAVFAAVIVSLYQSVNAHNPVNWMEVLQVAEAAGLGYLVKNFLTDANGKFLGVM